MKPEIESRPLWNSSAAQAFENGLTLGVAGSGAQIGFALKCGQLETMAAGVVLIVVVVLDPCEF